MREKSPIAVFAALVFALALASEVLVADAAGPASRDYDKMKQPVAPAPVNPNAKAFMNDQKSPNQPAKPAQPQPVDRIESKLPPRPPAANPQAVGPVAPSAKPPAPAQPPRPYVKSPGPQPQDPKKDATFVNKVSTAPGPTPAAKRPETGYNATLKDLGR